MNAETITKLDTTILFPHPGNPRIEPRQDIIEQLAELMAQGFDPSHALIVRPIPDGYQIISGHHRLLAAERAGLAEVPCWIREMPDDKAYMQLVLCNTQSELHPLEIGKHAVESGQSMTAYAKILKESKQNINLKANAYEVYSLSGCLDFAGIKDKWSCLAEIKQAPEWLWQALVAQMIEGEWTVATTRQMVGNYKTAEQPPEKRNAAHLSLRGALQAITAEEAPEEAGEDSAPAKLDEWIDARVSGGDFIAETIMLMDADGQSVPDIAARLKLSESYVQAALMPVAPKRAKACKRSSSDKAEIDIEGANAEDLYHDVLSWELHQYRRRTTRIAATLAASEIIERPDLASLLNHSIKSITREAVTKPREAVTIKDLGAKAAATVDWLHAIEGATPLDRWSFPIWAWVGVTLPIITTDEARQHKLGRAWWAAAGMLEPHPKNMAREVERLDWVRAAEVLVHCMAHAGERDLLRAKEVQG